MITNTLKTDSVYLVVQRKLFTRLALPYEVVLDSWCCTLDGKSLVSAELAQRFVDSDEFSEDHIVLQLDQNCSAKPAYSFSQLEGVFFSSSDALEQFLDRSYDNYDVNTLNCIVVAKQRAELDESSVHIQLAVPVAPTPKPALVPNDGAIALLYEKVTSESSSVAELQDLFADKHDSEELVLSLFDQTVLAKTDEVEILKAFIKLCYENSLDVGWNPSTVLQDLHNRVSEEIRVEEKFQIWEKKANDLFSGSAELTIPLDDEGSAILRAIILVLLNPEMDNLVGIKQNFGDRIGTKVFRTARKLVLLRAGYSLFTHEERAKLGEAREFAQDLNAALYNNELFNFLFSEDEVVNPPSQSSKSDHQTEVANIEGAVFDLANVPFISETEEQFEDKRVYAIDGLVPNAGFKSSLIKSNTGELLLWLIDRRIDEKKSKYKGKMGLDLIQIQSALPNDYRFEVDTNGVYLTLPASINNDSALLQAIKLAAQELALIKAFNVRKSTLIS
jgi:hypothetical protein